MSDTISLDSLLPPAMAAKAEGIGIKKAGMDPLTTFVLAVLAGAFISLGAIFCTTTMAGSSALPFGIARLAGGLVFTLGLILVVVGGAELFTGNSLIIMAFANGKVSLLGLLRNWAIVYLGNFAGSVATAYLMFLTKQYAYPDHSGLIGLTALNTANGKLGYEFLQAVALGIMCNALVCLAVWLTYSARTTVDKIVAIIPPIAAFVAAGFEHSIANMYFVPLGIFIKDWASPDLWTSSAFQAAGKTAESYAALTWGNFLVKNLLPVTIGNIIGGAVMVGLVYWFVYLRQTEAKAAPSPAASREKKPAKA